MESDTRQIALGLRRGDFGAISFTCWADATGLTILCRRRGCAFKGEALPTTGSPALSRGSSGSHAILLSMPCVSGECSVWTQMMMVVFGRRLLPMSLRHSPLRRGRKMLNGLLARCKPWSPSIAKPSYCAFKKIFRSRRYPPLWERRCLLSLQEFIEGWQRCGRSSREKQHEHSRPRKFSAHDRREPGGRHRG